MIIGEIYDVISIFFLGNPLHLQDHRSPHFLLVLTRLERELVVDNPFIRLVQHASQLHNELTQVVLLVEISSLIDTDVHSQFRQVKDLVLDHLEFNCYGQLGQL